MVNETFILVSMVVLGLIVVMSITVVWVAIWTNRKPRADPDFEALQASHPEGYWMGIGVALGVALGLPLGLAINGAMGDAGSGTAIGPAMGVAIGVAIGAALEQRHKGETRPLTSYEKRPPVDDLGRPRGARAPCCGGSHRHTGEAAAVNGLSDLRPVQAHDPPGAVWRPF